MSKPIYNNELFSEKGASWTKTNCTKALLDTAGLLRYGKRKLNETTSMWNEEICNGHYLFWDIPPLCKPLQKALQECRKRSTFNVWTQRTDMPIQAEADEAAFFKTHENLIRDALNKDYVRLDINRPFINKAPIESVCLRGSGPVLRASGNAEFPVHDSVYLYKVDNRDPISEGDTKYETFITFDYYSLIYECGFDLYMAIGEPLSPLLIGRSVSNNVHKEHIIGIIMPRIM